MLLAAGEPFPKAVLRLPGLANPTGVPAALAGAKIVHFIHVPIQG
jgi:hypothetical protein